MPWDARWRIENEVYKTLKTVQDGDRTGKHNDGHGKQHLMSHFILLMLMAFMLDQLQTLGSEEFQAALAKKDHRPSYLWKTMRGALDLLLQDRWTTLYGIISEDLSVIITRENLSDPRAESSAGVPTRWPSPAENRHQSASEWGEGLLWSACPPPSPTRQN